MITTFGAPYVVYDNRLKLLWRLQWLTMSTIAPCDSYP
jgi:hypothetical protein